MSRILRHFYRLLLCLCPPDFRQEFACEMEWIFARRLSEAAEAGRVELIRLCTREFVDLLLLLLAEWWTQLLVEKNAMNGTVVRQPQTGKGSWSGAFLAAMPHLLAPAVARPGFVLFTLGIYRIRSFMEPGFVLLVALMLLVSWRRGWPRWSGSWVGYAIAIAFLVLLNGLMPLLRASSAVTRYAVDADLDIWLPDAAIWLLWLLVSLAALSLLARRDPAAGLLAVLPIAPIFLAHVGGSRGDGPFFLGVALLTAGVAAAVCRGRRLYLALGLVLACNLVAVLPGWYLGTASLVIYMMWLAPPLLLVLWQGLRHRQAHA